MPSCEINIIAPAMRMVQECNPRVILDIGVGFGKWGLLCREYLDGWQGRPFRHTSANTGQTWQTHLIGIEPFKPYIARHQQRIYDVIHYQTAQDFFTVQSDPRSVFECDLVLAMDVLEHMPREAALGVIREACRVSRHCVFSIPLGDTWLDCNQSYLAINPLERHLSTWDLSDIENLAGCQKSDTVLVPGARGPIGIFHFVGRG